MMNWRGNLYDYMSDGSYVMESVLTDVGIEFDVSLLSITEIEHLIVRGFPAAYDKLSKDYYRWIN